MIGPLCESPFFAHLKSCGLRIWKVTLGFKIICSPEFPPMEILSATMFPKV